MSKEYKYIGMAELIRDYLLTFRGKQSIVRLTAKEARQLDVGRAMEYVSEHFVYGKQVDGTERGKGNSTYAFDFEVDKIL